jgi:hypothetical protein
MKARQHFYRLGQRAASWRLAKLGAFQALTGCKPKDVPWWAFSAFVDGYMDQAGYWARR